MKISSNNFAVEFDKASAEELLDAGQQFFLLAYSQSAEADRDEGTDALYYRAAAAYHTRQRRFGKSAEVEGYLSSIVHLYEEHSAVVQHLDSAIEGSKGTDYYYILRGTSALPTNDHELAYRDLDWMYQADKRTTGESHALYAMSIVFNCSDSPCEQAKTGVEAVTRAEQLDGPSEELSQLRILLVGAMVGGSSGISRNERPRVALHGCCRGLGDLKEPDHTRSLPPLPLTQHHHDLRARRGPVGHTQAPAACTSGRFPYRSRTLRP